MARAAVCKSFQRELLNAELAKTSGAEFKTVQPRDHEHICDQEEYKNCCWPRPCAIDGKKER